MTIRNTEIHNNTLNVTTAQYSIHKIYRRAKVCSVRTAAQSIHAPRQQQQHYILYSRVMTS